MATKIEPVSTSSAPASAQSAVAPERSEAQQPTTTTSPSTSTEPTSTTTDAETPLEENAEVSAAADDAHSVTPFDAWTVSYYTRDSANTSARECTPS